MLKKLTMMESESNKYVLSARLGNTNKIVTEKDYTELKKAQKNEAERIKNNWKYYKVSDKIQILIPFGTDGMPTEMGRRMIEQFIKKL